ncbi:MAG: DUF2029 domain-containing protein [Cryomorphaceae bacterium]|nr:DUF2029 domain-containing protein [Cryomorphaceae bacterium]
MNQRHVIVLSIIILLYGVLNFVNGRFDLFDFQVYYDACGKLLNGESPYQQAFGLSSGFYKYSPFAAWLFAPFHFFGWMGARVLFFLLLTAAIAVGLPWVVGKTTKIVAPVNVNAVGVLVIVGVTLGGHFSRELLLGNVNWLLFLAVFAAFILLEKKPLVAGLLIGAVLLFKPHFIVVLPWLILRKEFRVLAYTALAMLVLLLVPAPFSGWGWNLALIPEWLGAMQAHNTSLVASPNTVYAPFGGFTSDTIVVFGLLAVIGFAVLAMMLNHFRQEKSNADIKHANSFVEFSVILALIPNLVHTDTEHFMWTAPLIALVASYWFQSNRREKVVVGMVWLLCLIPYTLATPDIWGKDSASWLQESGVLGLSNLVFIGLGIYSFYKLRPGIT